MQKGPWSSQVGGQALPHSLYVIPLGHSGSGLGAVVISSDGHFSAVKHAPPCSSDPGGQKQPTNHRVYKLGHARFGMVWVSEAHNPDSYAPCSYINHMNIIVHFVALDVGLVHSHMAHWVGSRPPSQRSEEFKAWTVFLCSNTLYHYNYM